MPKPKTPKPNETETPPNDESEETPENEEAATDEEAIPALRKDIAELKETASWTRQKITETEQNQANLQATLEAGLQGIRDTLTPKPQEETPPLNPPPQPENNPPNDENAGGLQTPNASLEASASEIPPAPEVPPLPEKRKRRFL